MLSSFEDLEVFKRAYVLSLEIHKRSIEFLKVEQYGLGDQIRKASKSLRQPCGGICQTTVFKSGV
jgi:hypothetical protein